MYGPLGLRPGPGIMHGRDLESESARDSLPVSLSRGRRKETDSGSRSDAGPRAGSAATVTVTPASMLTVPAR